MKMSLEEWAQHYGMAVADGRAALVETDDPTEVARRLGVTQSCAEALLATRKGKKK